ncbi:MAG TPA: hypothetical protein VNU97_19280 [Rhizomicrobium sp.]|jgi:hypothetical protein|nr:hypothetical protein [Rhizomicrobium sp.]
MAVNIVFCASDDERKAAIAVLQAAGKTPVSFPASDTIATTATVSGNALTQTGALKAAFVVVG